MGELRFLFLFHLLPDLSAPSCYIYLRLACYFNCTRRIQQSYSHRQQDIIRYRAPRNLKSSGKEFSRWQCRHCWCSMVFPWLVSQHFVVILGCFWETRLCASAAHPCEHADWFCIQILALWLDWGRLKASWQSSDTEFGCFSPPHAELRGRPTFQWTKWLDLLNPQILKKRLGSTGIGGNWCTHLTPALQHSCTPTYTILFLHFVKNLESNKWTSPSCSHPEWIQIRGHLCIHLKTHMKPESCSRVSCPIILFGPTGLGFFGFLGLRLFLIPTSRSPLNSSVWLERSSARSKPLQHVCGGIAENSQWYRLLHKCGTGHGTHRFDCYLLRANLRRGNSWHLRRSSGWSGTASRIEEPPPIPPIPRPRYYLSHSATQTDSFYISLHAKSSSSQPCNGRMIHAILFAFVGDQSASTFCGVSHQNVVLALLGAIPFIPKTLLQHNWPYFLHLDLDWTRRLLTWILCTFKAHRPPKQPHVFPTEQCVFSRWDTGSCMIDKS